MNLGDMLGNTHMTWHSVLNFVLSWTTMLVIIVGLAFVYKQRDLSREMRWLVLGLTLSTIDNVCSKLFPQIFPFRSDNMGAWQILAEALYLAGALGGFFTIYGLVLVIKDVRARLAANLPAPLKPKQRRIAR